MNAPLNHEGNTFEPTQRWRPATVLLEALLSLAVLLLIAGLAFLCWRVLAHKPDAFASKAAKSQPVFAIVMVCPP